MPIPMSFAAPRGIPGWKLPHSVPFGGKSGLRKLPKVRPKLSKIEKKALRWAQKHPEDPNPPNNAVTWTSASAATATPTFYGDLTGRYGDLTGRLNQFVGQPATQATLTAVNQAVRVYTNGLYTGTGTNGWVNNATVTFTTAATNAITVNLPMSWDAWNTNWTPTTLVTPTNDWARWQGQGNQADLHYNPNDQVQRERLRRERVVQDEAQYQQQRMERAARAAEQQRQWDAGAPERVAALARQATAERVRQEAVKTSLKRSYELLFRHLTDEQKNMLESENRFLIEVKSGKIYEIRRGMHQNIYRLDDQGRPDEQLCCLPQGHVPEGDVMLAQMLHLMCNEEGFRKVANRWELRDMRGQLDRRRPLTEGAIQVDRRAA